MTEGFEQTDFDTLVDATRMAHNKNAEHELWRRCLALEHWYCIGVGEGEEMQPLIAAVEGKPHLIAFTDEERAHEFGRRLAAKKGGAVPTVIHMEVDDAVDYCRVLYEYHPEVHGVHFNDGGYAFDCLMSELIDRWGRAGKG
ncbi:MAG: hypothetical protein EA423_05365 [Phycisphaerales bacterium]|nr:MAG: hypothetical protein EA423_05365 [Phycisphaerales bacterium]